MHELTASAPEIVARGVKGRRCEGSSSSTSRSRTSSCPATSPTTAHARRTYCDPRWLSIAASQQLGGCFSVRHASFRPLRTSHKRTMLPSLPPSCVDIARRPASATDVITPGSRISVGASSAARAQPSSAPSLRQHSRRAARPSSRPSCAALRLPAPAAPLAPSAPSPASVPPKVRSRVSIHSDGVAAMAASEVEVHATEQMPAMLR